MASFSSGIVMTGYVMRSAIGLLRSTTICVKGASDVVKSVGRGDE